MLTPSLPAQFNELRPRGEAVAAAVQSDPAHWAYVWMGVSFVVGLVVVVLIYRWLSGWARGQILESPGRRLHPTRWVVSVLMVAALAFAFDKIDVSRVLAGDATVWDTVASIATGLMLTVYAAALRFLWSCENKLGADVGALLRDCAVQKGIAETLKQTLTNERRLASFLNSITGERWRRLRGLLNEDHGSVTPHALNAALDPASQFTLIMTMLFRFVNSHYRGGIAPEEHMRIAYYEPVDGNLRCVASYDGRIADCIQNPNKGLSDYFQLNERRATDCLSVYCSLKAPRDPFVIEDTEAAHDDQGIPFRFLAESQRDHIRSMVAFCCRGAHTDEPPHPVLTIDCSQRGFFKDSDESRDELAKIMDELSLRAVFERDVGRLLSRLTLETAEVPE